MRSVSHIEKFRIKDAHLESGEGDRSGVFIIPLANNRYRKETVAICVVDDGSKTGWEHVSICMGYDTGKGVKNRPPSVEELSCLKEAFWLSTETAACYYSREMNEIGYTYGDEIVHLWAQRRVGLLRRLWRAVLGRTPHPPVGILKPEAPLREESEALQKAMAEAKKEEVKP